MSAVKKHPFFQAAAGAVFAIALTPDQWGFVRFFRGLGMAVLSVVGSSSRIPNVDWRNPPVGWVFFSFAPKTDTTVVVPLGTVPFADEADEWGPPCFDPPDIIQNCFRIHERGMIRRGTKDDVQGMTRCRTVKPAELAEFLRERLKSGELRAV